MQASRFGHLSPAFGVFGAMAANSAKEEWALTGTPFMREVRDVPERFHMGKLVGPPL